MKNPILLLAILLSTLALADDAKLRGGNILSCETYSFRDMIRAGKLDMLQAPEFYKELGIKGISYNDMFFKRDRKSTRLNSSHIQKSRMPSSA